MDEAVRRDSTPAVDPGSPLKSENRPPASSTMTCIAARSHSLTPSASTAPSTPLPRPACTTRSRRSRGRARLAVRSPARSFSIANESTELLDGRDRGDVDPLSVRERSCSALGPPATCRARAPRRRRARRRRSILERDQRRPDRDAARVVPRAVDRVDDPAPRAPARGALLLAQDRVVRPLRPRGFAGARPRRRDRLRSPASGRASSRSRVPSGSCGSEIASAASASRSASSRSGLTPPTLARLSAGDAEGRARRPSRRPAPTRSSPGCRPAPRSVRGRGSTRDRCRAGARTTSRT